MTTLLDKLRQPIDRSQYNKQPILLIVAMLIVPCFWQTAAKLGSAAQPQDGSGASWVPIGLIVFIGYVLLAMLISIVFTLMSAFRKEKFWIMRLIIYIIYGTPVLGGALLILSSLVIIPFRN